MKKIIICASALFMSSSAIAGMHYSSDAKQMKPVSARASSAVLAPKDPSLARMETSRLLAADAGDKQSGMAMQHPQMDHAAMAHGRSAEQMRTNSALALQSGRQTYTGVGGPDGNEDRRV
jgi:hypothetical protein